jgi:hypothetical protein
MSLAQILQRAAPEEQHNVQSRRNSSVSYHVNKALSVICDEGITVSSFTPKLLVWTSLV